MKKNWKIIVGIIFLIGGIECARSSDMEAAALGIVVGIAWIVWWVADRKRSAKKSSKSAASPLPAVQATQESAKQAAPPTPAPVPAKAQTAAQTLQRAEASSAAKQKEKGYDVLIPEKKDGAPLAYRYSVPFVPSDLDAVLAAAKAEHWYLSAKQIGGDVHLFSGEADLGVLKERADMVSDWLRREDPYLAILERISSETGCTVMLVFYRDKQKYNAHREQTVVALTGYKGEEKQEQLLYLNPGDELELEEDYEKEGCVLVLSHGSELGYLPKKYAGRFLEEVFDHEEPVEDSDISKPFVKIYW